MPILLLLLLLLACAPQVRAQEVPLELQPKELRVLAWNIYMLPPLILTTNKIKRAEAIGDTLSKLNYDVIVFNEGFHPFARTKITKHLQQKYPHVVGPITRKGFSRRISSGVWIWSKYPMYVNGTTIFQQAAGFDNKQANKGAVMVTVSVDNAKFQIVGTHLNSGGPFAVRQSQMKQIYDELIKPNERQGVMQLICGDMNTVKANQDEYHTMLSTYQASDGPLQGTKQCTSCAENDWHDATTKVGTVIDYIFVRPNGVPHSIYRASPYIEKRFNTKHRSLSDHEPVEAIIQYN